MTESTELPDLSRTAAALEAHDRAYAELHAYYDRATRDLNEVASGRLAATDTEIDRLVGEVHLRAAEVGVSYGLDTADRNDPEECAVLIRPGSPTPPPGTELSFVRRMVAQWRAGRG